MRGKRLGIKSNQKNLTEILGVRLKSPLKDRFWRVIGLIFIEMFAGNAAPAFADESAASQSLEGKS